MAGSAPVHRGEVGCGTCAWWGALLVVGVVLALLLAARLLDVLFPGPFSSGA